MKPNKLAKGALIGALYVLLTVAFAPISFGLVQLRVSEALTVLPFFTSAAVPGLFVGCLLSNLILGAPVYDVVFGSLATLIAACLTRALARRDMSRWLAPIPPVIINGLIVGAVLCYGYGLGGYWVCSAAVAAGEAVAAYALGMPILLSKKLEKIISDKD